MSLDLRAEPAPLRVDANGVVRVGGTRVTLHTIVTSFHGGLGAEEIADRYPSLTLADVYSVIGYYLRHWPSLDVYLAQQRAESNQFREDSRQRWPSRELRTGCWRDFAVTRSSERHRDARWSSNGTRRKRSRMSGSTG